MAEKENKKEVSKTVVKLTTEISKLSVLELSELVNELQDVLGVSAIPVAAAAPAVAATNGEESAADEGGNKTVVLTETGDSKIAVIKALRVINPLLGLKDAKDATENVPFEVIKDAKAEDAKEAAEKLKAAGATVELK